MPSVVSAIHTLSFQTMIALNSRSWKNVGKYAEQREGQQRVDALGAALDDARQAARLALEVKAQGQRMDMGEGRDADLAQRVILYLGEDTVAQLGEGLHQDARRRVGADEAEGQRHCRRRNRRPCEAVGDPAENDGGNGRRQNGKCEADQRNNDPELEVGPAFGPQIRQQHIKRPERRRAVARTREGGGDGPFLRVIPLCCAVRSAQR